MKSSTSCNLLLELCAEAGNCGVDVGGTLAKVAYVRRSSSSRRVTKDVTVGINSCVSADAITHKPSNVNRTAATSSIDGPLRSYLDTTSRCCRYDKRSSTDCGDDTSKGSAAVMSQQSNDQQPCRTEFLTTTTSNSGHSTTTNSGSTTTMTTRGVAGDNAVTVEEDFVVCCHGNAELVIQLGDDYELRFRHFLSKNIDEVTNFIADASTSSVDGALNVTGGGAYKYRKNFEDRLNLEVRKIDEMQSLMIGLHFFLRHTNSVYRYDCTTKDRISVKISDPMYPFLLVNIGSGVSIIKATGPEQFQRVTGTCIGGGTVLGLARQTCGADSFEEVLRWAEAGTDCLDLKVKDLFGDSAGTGWLPVDTLASSFGRLYMGSAFDPKKVLLDGANPFASSCTAVEPPRKEDVCRSIVRMVAYNVGYIAFLVGTIHRIRRVFFAGKFVNNRALTMDSITEGVSFYLDHYSAIAAAPLSDDTGRPNTLTGAAAEEAEYNMMIGAAYCDSPQAYANTVVRPVHLADMHTHTHTQLHTHTHTQIHTHKYNNNNNSPH
eukprot:Lankesteria_metandrocarpae@DN5366_c0_g1_i5.p1